MKQGVVEKKNIGRLLREAAGNRRLFAPRRRGNEVELSEMPGDAEPLLVFSNFKQSPKRLFMPQCETLCAFEDDQIVDTPLPDEGALLFGIRPCDALALARLDRMFGEFGKTRDPYYLARRENSTIVSLACNEPRETCFCASVGRGPASPEGADAVAFDIGDDLFFEARTAKGESFLDGARAFLREPLAADVETRDRLAREAAEKTNKLDLSGMKETLEKSFDAEAWKAVSEICLGCGLCTYLCPTCHCFDITDETKGGAGRRIRTWDSCQYALFTLHASGHNPRPSKKERMRQRILHKFVYTVDNMGDVFCVGCGRCVQSCPVNLDIREVLAGLKARLAGGDGESA